MSSEFLRINGLSKRFGDLRVLDNLDLDIPLNSHTTVIGKSGIGKSVLLKCLSGLLEPDSGSVSLDGREGEVPQCAYMFQQNALFDSMTVMENVSLPLREKTRLTKAELSDRARALIKQLDLGDASGKYPAELSGGMKKRVALARALITSPEIILFDEPTTGLDPERKFSVFDMIRDYRKRFGFTVIMVSHDVPEVFGITDRVAWLDAGKIKFWGTPDNLLDAPPSELEGFLNPKLSPETSAA